MELYVVRHSLPDVDPGVAPDAWTLSPEGRLAAEGLRHRLPSPATFVSSPETKAADTLSRATGTETSDVVTDAGFGEVRRPGEPFDDEVAARRRAWVEGRLDHRHVGWETPAQAAARFGAAIARHRPATGPLVVSSHGMVMTAWLASVDYVRAGEAAGLFWSELGFPDVVTLSI